MKDESFAGENPGEVLIKPQTGEEMIWVFIILAAAALLVLLYFLSIMPRMIHKPEREAFIGVYYAHRGLHDNEGTAPENSVAAFKKAVEAGYGIELDVQITKDKIPVVFHDFTLKRVCGREGKICDYTLKELKEFKLFNTEETIPHFEEVLQIVKGKVPLIVELKVEWTDLSVCSAANELLKLYKGLYCIESFNPMALMWYRRYRNDVMRGQLSDGFIRSGEYKGILYRILQNLCLNWMTKPDFIAYNYMYADIRARRLCRSLYKNLAVAWTIKSMNELQEARDQFDMFIFEGFLPEGLEVLKTNKN